MTALMNRLAFACQLAGFGLLLSACDFTIQDEESNASSQLPQYVIPTTILGDVDTADIAAAVDATLVEWLPPEMEARGVPGMAFAVVGRDQVFREEVLGVTDGDASSPITPDTLFNIRSISKSVTALAVLVAVQDGLVDLDTPITEYLPGFTVNSRFEDNPAELMTLRHLLSHWASFTHDPPAGLDMDQPGYFEAYIERISQSWLRFPVGYRHQYANYGVDLAGYILQVRSGMPFADYAREKVLRPIGMATATFDLEVVEYTQTRAVGHNSEGQVVPVRLPEIPAAGLYASLRDMTRHAQFLLNGGVANGERILSAELMAEYHAIQFARSDQRTGYALGLIREVIGDTYALYHEGGGRGFGSHLIVYPELGIGVITLSNREYHGLTGFEGRQVINAPVIESVGPRSVAEAGTERMRQLDPNDPRIQAVIGRYGDSPGAVIGFEDGELGIRFDDTRFSALTFYDDGGELVALYATRSEVRFLPPFGDQHGSLMWINRAFSNSNINYADFNDAPNDPLGPARPEWQQYVGEYEIIWEDEPNSSATLTIRNGHIYFRDGKCVEYEPGLFFRYDGEALDFRSEPATYANQEIRRSASN